MTIADNDFSVKCFNKNCNNFEEGVSNNCAIYYSYQFEKCHAYMDTPGKTHEKPDPVNHPPHYIEGRTIEPIDVIEDWSLSYHLGNALKYISRAGRKSDAVEDIKKAIWYLNRYVEKEGVE
jgi:hypothetical protein